MAGLILLGLLETLDSMSFVVSIMVFSYILFWLYMTFRESQILFGISSIVAGYFILVAQLPTVFLVIIFAVFFVMGQQLQMFLQFAVFPFLRIFGVELEREGYGDQMKMQEIQHKLMEGKNLSSEETKYLEDQQKKENNYKTKMEQIMMRQNMGM